jgi:hypothetical protein
MKTQEKLQQEKILSGKAVFSMPLEEHPLSRVENDLSLGSALIGEISTSPMPGPSPISSPSTTRLLKNHSDSASEGLFQLGIFTGTPVRVKSASLFHSVECLLEYNQEFSEGKLTFTGGLENITQIAQLLNLCGHDTQVFNETGPASLSIQGKDVLKIFEDITKIKRLFQDLGAFVQACFKFNGEISMPLPDNQVTIRFDFNQSQFIFTGDEKILNLLQCLMPKAQIQAQASELVFSSRPSCHLNPLLMQIVQLKNYVENFLEKPVYKAYDKLGESVEPTNW